MPGHVGTRSAPLRRVAAGTRPFAAVVVTYNSAAHLPGLLDSLFSGIPVPSAVLVVDNGSTDATVVVARSGSDRRPALQVVDAGANLGYAGGLQRALGLVPDGTDVLVLNPDVELLPGAVATLLAQLADDGVGVVVPRLQDAQDRLYPSLRREPTVLRAAGDALLGARLWPRRPALLSEQVPAGPAYGAPADVEWATGAALLLSAECLRRVGAWDERFFLYSEETDYCRRARQAGLRVRYVPAAAVRHTGAGSGASAELDALLAVNRVRYYRKWHGPVRTAVFHGVVCLGELARCRGRAHRRALALLVRPRRWPGQRAALQTGTP